MTLLSDGEIESGLAATQWRRDGDELVRELELDDFEAAMAKANAVATIAQQLDHHPDILVHGWNKLTLRVSTHSTSRAASTPCEPKPPARLLPSRPGRRS
jgi:4a-hydroxytetrahydrobiopterin dehydratase